VNKSAECDNKKPRTVL